MLFMSRHLDLFRLNRGVTAEPVDTALSRGECKNRKRLGINCLRFHGWCPEQAQNHIFKRKQKNINAV